MGKILEIKNLVKLFPVKKGLFRKTVAHVHAVDDVSFYINESETFGLVGESGCGKTTVGKLIMQLHKADSGSIIYNGADLCSLPKKELSRRRSEVQIVFQDPYGSLNPRMKVADILSEGIRKHRLLPPDQDRGCPGTVVQPEACGLRRAGFRSGRICSGADTQPYGGAAKEAWGFIPVYRSRHGRGQAHLPQGWRHVSWEDGGACTHGRAF